MVEKRHQCKFGEGLTALNYTATRLPANTDIAIRNLLHVCDGSSCEKTLLAKQEVIEGVHIQGGPLITISLCRKCYTVYLCRKDRKVEQLRYMKDSQYDAISHIEKMLNTMFAHKAVEAYRKLLKIKAQIDGTKSSLYVDEAIAL